MTLAAVVKAARVVGKGLGFIEEGHKREKLERGGSARNVMGEGKVNVRAAGEEEDEGGVFDIFKGFGASRKAGGSMEGIMKIFQMLV